MDSKDETFKDVNAAVDALSQKIKTLQNKVNELCKSTGDCDRIKKVNKDLSSPKGKK
tara:strand:+ start:737 stop:907 length:171 start_codon:yes stop_codon:yes gene_type:complete